MSTASRLLGFLLLAAWVSAVGCVRDKPESTKSAASSRAARRQSSQQTALFNSIRSQLRTLPDSAQMDLTPPVVVLDNRATATGEDLQAVLMRPPGAIDGPANHLVLKGADGVRLRGVVKPGDTAKFYAVYDRETQDRIREAGDVGIATFDSVDLEVAQVVGEDTLLVEGGAVIEIDVPTKLEVWRTVDDRMEEIAKQYSAYALRREPPLAWHPSPDEAEFRHLTERLNQWLRQTHLAGAGANADAGDWVRPALLATLPERLAGSEHLGPTLTDEQLSLGYFQPHESRLIQGALWRRDVARWARGGASDATAVAESLFDWTVRNLQLVADAETPPRWPWEAMLHGRATVAGRAWVFAGLCEQRNLTAAAVVAPVEGGDRTLVGVLDGDQLRLFDPTLGLPLPGAEPGTVASLAEAQADDSLLRQLDLPDAPYPLTSEALRQARVGVVASPFALTRRAATLASKLTAEEAVVLASDVDAAAERLRAAAGVGEVSLWEPPFQTLVDKHTAPRSLRNRAVRDFLPFAWRPHLWRGRTLQFRGQKKEADAARGPLDEGVDDHRAALQDFMDRRVRPTDRVLARQTPEKREIYQAAKRLATLFLATLKFDQGDHRVAKGWLENATLDAPAAQELRSTVLYNRARAAETLGDLADAIATYRSIDGPTAPGARIRARTLQERLDREAATDAEADDPATAEASDEADDA